MCGFPHSPKPMCPNSILWTLWHLHTCAHQSQAFLPDLLALRDQTSLLYSSALSTCHGVWQIADARWLIPKERELGTLSLRQLLNTAWDWLSSTSHDQLFFHGWLHVPLCDFHLQLGSLPWSTHAGPVPFLDCDHRWNSLVCLPALLVSYPPLWAPWSFQPFHMRSCLLLCELFF